MFRRYRLIEMKDDELCFSNGVQHGTLLVGVDTLVGDEGPRFHKRDVTGIDLSIVVGTRKVPCHGHVAELTTDWLDTPGNWQLLARKVEWAEERDPTRRVDRRPGFNDRWFA
jgi:hypothetical protein